MQEGGQTATEWWKWTMGKMCFLKINQKAPQTDITGISGEQILELFQHFEKHDNFDKSRTCPPINLYKILTTLL